MTATISGDGTSTLINLTTSGNTVLGDASTDTLNVGNGGLVKDASGNVGIGTASPAAKLDVSGGSLRINEDGAGTKIITMRSNYASLGPAINVTTNDPLLFLTNNTERMRIDSSGNLTQVGVTTASGLVMSALGSTSSNTTVNSSTYNVNISGSAKVFWVSLGSGDGCLVVTNYITTTITIVGTGGNIVASASPTSSQLGISKSANSHVVTFKTGSAAATQFGAWSVASLSSAVS